MVKPLIKIPLYLKEIVSPLNVIATGQRQKSHQGSKCHPLIGQTGSLIPEKVAGGG